MIKKVQSNMGKNYGSQSRITPKREVPIKHLGKSNSHQKKSLITTRKAIAKLMKSQA